ncbi:helix-turn-helix domain-containing protein [Patescibacteria group bacterium]|nr:helix-turn-helix domain-containing protein [Patescibacteria group bacterium]
MSRLKDHELALKLRKENKSYSQIKKILNVSKGTLSNWLRKYPLSKEQIRLLRDVNEKRIERFRETMNRKRVTRLKNILEVQKEQLLPLSKREFLLCGLMLYLGEGTKTNRYRVAMTNSDPCMMRFMLSWFTDILKIPKKNIRVYLHLYNNMNLEDEINFWENKLNIHREQFIKPYIKNSNEARINHKGSFGHGTCTIYCYNVKMKDEISMSIKAIMDNYK